MSRRPQVVRDVGEHSYHDWMYHSRQETPFSLFVWFSRAPLFALMGTALILFGGQLLVPFGIGIGFLGYAVVVLIYTLLSVRRRGWQVD